MKENWFLIGDIHGESAPVEYFYYQNRDRLKLDICENYMILLGDVGCNYSVTGSRDANFKRRLSELPFHYICMRGNHEARVMDVMGKYPNRWAEQEKYGGWIGVEKDFPQIEYLADGPGVYEFAGYKTLSLPGAYSVDKWIRIENGWNWFPNEQLTESEMKYGLELAEKVKSVDLVISHTCPIAFEPRDLFLSSVEQSKVDKTMEIYLGEIETKLDYRCWAWGHYHADRLYPWEKEREKLMLFHEKVVDLKKFMEMGKTDYLNDILA